MMTPLSSADHMTAIASSSGWASLKDLACSKWRPGSLVELSG
jgi:hypothetical protein